MTWAVHTCDWRALLDVVPRCDALIVDAPYSEKTHVGHRKGAGVSNMVTMRPTERRDLDYLAWTHEDVTAFVGAWAPRCCGWFVTITDHELAPVWSAALASSGRLAFAPLPFVSSGSRVRLAGDGPSCWAVWIVVARPRSAAFARWGALPGAYVLPAGLLDMRGNPFCVVGGKPLWLMERLVEDYSRPGDLICDPCCGAGTTLVAALRTGRHAVGGDCKPEHAQIARDWCTAESEQSTLAARRAGQVPLFGGSDG
jgi:hypothetical protein